MWNIVAICIRKIMNTYSTIITVHTYTNTNLKNEKHKKFMRHLFENSFWISFVHSTNIYNIFILKMKQKMNNSSSIIPTQKIEKRDREWDGEVENKTVEYCMTFIELKCAHLESELSVICIKLTWVLTHGWCIYGYCNFF